MVEENKCGGKEGESFVGVVVPVPLVKVAREADNFRSVEGELGNSRSRELSAVDQVDPGGRGKGLGLELDLRERDFDLLTELLLEGDDSDPE